MSSAVKSRKKIFSKDDVRVSRAGRAIKTPKNILTTSDEEPPPKKTKSSSFGEKMDKLKLLSAQLQLKSTTLSKRNESAAVTTSDNIRIGNKSATGASCSKTSSHETIDSNASEYESVTGSNCTKSDEFELGDSVYDSNQLSHTCMTGQPTLNNPANNSQTSVSGNVKLVESYKSSISKDPFIDTDIDNGKRAETFIDVPVININGSCAGCGVILDRLEVLETNINQISDQNTEILQILRKNFGNKQLSNRLYQNLEGYPITTVEQFRYLDNESNKEERQKVHDHLILLGGLTLKEFLHIAVRQIMADTLVLNYTWHKQKETEKFGDTRVSNVFYQAAVNCPLFAGPENKTVYKAAMLLVFKATKQRCRKLLNKNKDSKLENQVDAAIANISSLLGTEIDLSGSEAYVEDLQDDSTSTSEDDLASDPEDENFT